MRSSETPVDCANDSSAALAALKQQKRHIVNQYAHPDSRMGWWQTFSTLLPLAGLWWLAVWGASVSYALTALATLAMSFFLLRAFTLMHECGHDSLFRGAALNRAVGFAFGVVCGMPQYVWAKHHAYHHSTNGNWSKYRGPLATITADEYDALTPKQQRQYSAARRVVMAPLAGFLYLVFNPRFTWIKGTAQLAWHVARGVWRQPRVPLKTHAAQFKTGYWKTGAEYRHMALNNLVLLSLWVGMSWLMGPLLFFTVYLVSTSLSGAAGIVLFTVQHNFEHSHATGDQGWDYDRAALEGTSFLILPGWLNWFTTDIGYHHIHHLSARIPNHRLAACHAENRALFAGVKRLGLRDVHAALQCILWDTRASRIVSVAAHKAARALPG